LLLHELDIYHKRFFGKPMERNFQTHSELAEKLLPSIINLSMKNFKLKGPYLRKRESSNDSEFALVHKVDISTGPN
jgi:hypothetical protein